jgi:isoquinoline 1-oxidoreductase subunit beta
MSSIQWQVSRRGLLLGTTAVGTLALGSCALLKPAIPSLVDFGERQVFAERHNNPTDPLLWFEFSDTEGLVLNVPQAEMGQGVLTVIAQMAAEELEVPMTHLTVRPIPSTHGLRDMAGTFGSRSVRASYVAVRTAAATLREMLRDQAAVQLGVPAETIVCKEGQCQPGDDASRSLSYRQLLTSKTTPWTLPKKPVALKKRADFKLIGTPVQRVDTIGKINGATPFGISARRPNLAFGALVMPSRQGERMVSVDATAAKAMPGVLMVVVDLKTPCVGVVASTRSRAMEAAKAIQWVAQSDPGVHTNQADLERAVTATPGAGVLVRKRGDLTNEATHFETVGSYRTPLAAHAHLEPLSATVEVSSAHIEAWVPTQDVTMEAERLQDFWGSNRRVTVHPMPMGGSFGRKGFQSTVLQASILSEAAQRPVALAWTRQQEMQNSFYRHPTHSVFRGRCDAQGKILALEQSLCSGHNAVTRSAWDVLDAIQSSLELDGSMFTGFFSLYDIPRYRAYIRSVPIQVQTGIWRGVALVPNQFAFESFIDELASQANVDAIDFRRNNLMSTAEGERMRAVLSLVKERSGWATPSTDGFGRGVACSFFSNTAVAIVIEAKVQNGVIMVGRITAVIDAGLVVNPAGAQLQATGSILMGLSSALHEKVTLKDGVVHAANFDDYPLLRLAQTPKRIDVFFVDSPLDPRGLGEPVIGPVAPALANALMRATGRRHRELPLVV